MVGKTIGKYRLVEELSRDGTATLYKAVDETLDREVAVKMLNPRLAGSEALERFQAEATTLARLHHTDIVGIHEIYRYESDLLLVMELAKGETLEQMVARGGPLQPEQAGHLVAKILGALGHAHAAGVLHGDLKPSNITVTDGAHVKLTDFGLARAAGDEDLTSDGFTLQSPSYMAPERLGGKDVDARSDVYSAGVILYFLLTGHVPFEAPTPLEMVQRQLGGGPTPAIQFRPGLPGWCQAILDRAIARSPADRFQSAEALRASLVAATNEATEETGAFVVPAGFAPGDAPTSALSASMIATIPGMPAPSADAGARTVAANATPATTAIEVVPVAPTGAAAAPAPGPVAHPPPSQPGGATVVLKRRDMARIGGLLAALAIGVVVLAVVALRRHESATVTIVAEAPAVADAGVPPAATSPEGAAPASAPVLTTPPPADAPVAAPSPSTATKPEPVAGRPAAAGRVVDTTPFSFQAKAVVVDGSRYRERDAIVQMADGTVMVKDRDDREKTIYQFPVASVTELVYSNSRQPLTHSPQGPVEVMRVEAGAFGFLKGSGARNWLSLRTNDSLLVLRLEDDDAVKVMAALESRTGLTTESLVEGKD